MKPKSRSKSKPKPKPQIAIEADSPSEFFFAVARTAVSQICLSVGFNSSNLSALHTLTSVALAFLQSAAKSSSSIAAIANRTDSNLFDLSAALHGLRSGVALSAADISADQCPLRSIALADIAAFVASTPEIPFAKPVPRRRRCKRSISGAGDSNPRPPHVPNWLPEIPPAAGPARRERGEELWEESVIGVRVLGEERERERERELRFLKEERERVRMRFKVMMGLRKRNGIGEKRVHWDYHNHNNGD